MFNDKSKLVLFNGRNKISTIPEIKINGKVIEAVESFLHLGHTVMNDIFKTDSSKCIGYFNQQCNSLLGSFSQATSVIRNVLFQKYCMCFYGSQMMPLYDNHLEDVCRAWRVAMRRVWRLPWTTHCRLLPHLADTMPPELLLERRGVAFVHQMMNSDNDVVRNITGMARCGQYSILGANIRHLEAKYSLDVRQVNAHWQRLLEVDTESRRVACHINELCRMRDAGQVDVLSADELKMILHVLCTE